MALYQLSYFRLFEGTFRDRIPFFLLNIFCDLYPPQADGTLSPELNTSSGSGAYFNPVLNEVLVLGFRLFEGTLRDRISFFLLNFSATSIRLRRMALLLPS